MEDVNIMKWDWEILYISNRSCNINNINIFLFNSCSWKMLAILLDMVMGEQYNQINNEKEKKEKKIKSTS